MCHIQILLHWPEKSSLFADTAVSAPSFLSLDVSNLIFVVPWKKICLPQNRASYPIMVFE